MKNFQFFTASSLRMRACGTGRKFAEYYQRVTIGDVPKRRKAATCLGYQLLLELQHFFCSNIR
jgi:hypothetical protein